jgi:predicted lipoprotein with Yx(FWY)xxD motif
MRRHLAGGLIIILALVAAGCGGDDDASSGTSDAPTSGPTTTTSSPTTTETTSSSAGGAPAALKFGGIAGRPDVLTDAAGRAVYVFSGDENGAVTCLDACAEEWPGVPTDGDPVVEGGTEYDGGKQGLGDGRWQATFSGDPLYYYAGDTAPGQANGVGVEAFGGTFYLITRDYSRLAG